jgi:uncharacterized protein YndB with AHSA1/START domain
MYVSRPCSLFSAIAALSVMLFPASASAAVADSAANGFTVKLTLAIQAPPEEVFRRLIRNVGEWWDSEHTFSGDSHNLSIEERPMGCFCEKLPAGGGVRHMEVVNFVPGKKLVMIGGLGPLQGMASTGTLTILLAPSGKSTNVDVTYTVGGYVAGGLNTLAAPVDAVITQQFTRFRNYIERSDPGSK